MLPFTDPALAAADLPSQAAHLFFFLLAAALVAVNIVEGARAGSGRKFAALLGIVAAVLAYIFFRGFFGGLLEPLVPYPRPLVDVLGGVIGGALVFEIVCLAGILFCKKPSKEEGGRSLGSRFGGAVFGGALSLVYLAVLMILVRLSAAVLAPAAETAPASAQSGEGENGEPALAWFARALESIDASIERKPLKPFLTALDPIPEAFYTDLSRFTRLLEQPEKMRAFLEAPSVKNIAQKPSVREMLANEEVIAHADNDEVHALLRHPAVHKAVEDPAVQKAWRAADISGALERAFQGDAPGDAPHAARAKAD